MSYKWIANHCSNNTNVLIVDDDHVVNVDRTIAYLRTDDTVNQMYGLRAKCWNPVRSHNDEKSYISKEEYPFYYWPNFLIGGFVLTSTNVIIKMTRVIPYIKEINNKLIRN